MDANIFSFTIMSDDSAAISQYYLANRIELSDIQLTANHTINEANESVSINVNINSHNSYSNLTLHAIVKENTTTGNVGTNGETEFHDVLMKMVPDASGTLINIVAETPTTYTVTASLSETNIEEYSDFSVIVFIQKDDTKRIFQSANSAVTTNINSLSNNIYIFPNPTTRYFTVKSEKHINNIEIFDINGKLIISKSNISNNQMINISNFNEGIYFLKIKTDNAVKIQKLMIIKQ